MAKLLADARTALLDAFGGPHAFDVDATGEVIASAHAEGAIDHALDALKVQRRALSRGGR
jgi:hypothetical protein